VVKAIAAISFVYDLTAGLTLIFFRAAVASFVPPLGTLFQSAPLLVDLTAIFLTCIGVGYLLPYRRPASFRAYLWIFGVGLKTAGAIAFAFDYAWRGSPAVMVLFAFSDGLLAALTLTALMQEGLDSA
jgi:hypothetical protein